MVTIFRKTAQLTYVRIDNLISTHCLIWQEGKQVTDSLGELEDLVILQLPFVALFFQRGRIDPSLLLVLLEKSASDGLWRS